MRCIPAKRGLGGTLGLLSIVVQVVGRASPITSIASGMSSGASLLPAPHVA